MPRGQVFTGKLVEKKEKLLITILQNLLLYVLLYANKNDSFLSNLHLSSILRSPPVNKYELNNYNRIYQFRKLGGMGVAGEGGGVQQTFLYMGTGQIFVALQAV